MSRSCNSLSFRFSPVQVLWPRSCFITFFLTFLCSRRMWESHISPKCCQTLHTAFFLAFLFSRGMWESHISPKCCQTLHKGALSWKTAPSWLDKSQCTRYTQKRSESSPACFWKYMQKYKAKYLFVALRPQTIYPSVSESYFMFRFHFWS